MLYFLEITSQQSHYYFSMRIRNRVSAVSLPVASDPRATAGPRNIRCRVCPAALEIYCRSVGAYPWLRATTRSLRCGLLLQVGQAAIKRRAAKSKSNQPTGQATNQRTNKWQTDTASPGANARSYAHDTMINQLDSLRERVASAT